jgi:hypothetical protein
MKTAGIIKGATVVGMTAIAVVVGSIIVDSTVSLYRMYLAPKV